ncbi:hypothetical protein AURDEDRAFT_160114 [Auricularia subglabra TFB-10046 SS5]|nr:hypothetical protein AURDEDRAFT_160114 [Auricularia subglabra TFB-10046 SS5]
MLPLLSGLLAISSFAVTRADVSIYEYPVPRPTPGYTYKGWQAYDPGQPLKEPPLPDSAMPLDFAIELDTSGNPKAGKEQLGSFLGISIEMSLAEAIIGPNRTWLRPQFLNLMSTVKERGGAPVLRLGGNTQEKAQMVDDMTGLVEGVSSDAVIGKLNGVGPSGVTETPTMFYKVSILEALRESSNILGIQWFLGIPLNVTDPPRLDIIERGEEIMGEYLWSWEGPYDIPDYMREFQTVVNAIAASPKIKNKNKLGGPAVCCSWTYDQMLNEHKYLETFGSVLNSFIIEHYPAQNCQGFTFNPDDAQATLEKYMKHDAAIAYKNEYADVVPVANAAGKPVILLETNTGSCNGFLGLSDAFASALWATDLALQLAANDWTHMMLHLGGQKAYYNPFVPPPHNATAPFQWTVGPIMYGILAVAEALGDTGKARVADLGANGGNSYTPGYVIYENNQPARILLINFMSDKSGGHDYTARIATNAAQVRVRYMLADSVLSKTGVTWAGQASDISFGGYFESDGLLRGEHKTETVACSGGVCPVRVPGPSIALVFLTESSYEPQDSMQTFATSHTTRMHNTAAVDGLTLQTSNGLDAEDRDKLRGSSTSGFQRNSARALSANTAFPFVALVAALAFVFV